MASDEADTPVTCPECQHKFGVGLLAAIPESQKLNVALESETDLFAADGVGEIISATSKLLMQVGKNCGERVCVFLADCTVKPRRVELKFVVARVDKKPKRPAPAGERA